MKSLLPRLLTLLTLLMLAALSVLPSAWAAAVTWSTVSQIAGDSDVATSGTSLAAYCNGTASGPVNGTTFSAMTVNSGSLGTYVDLAGWANSGANIAGSGGTWNGFSANYKSVLTHQYETNSGTPKVTFKGLTVGHHYSVQFWVGDWRNFPTTIRRTTITGAGGNSPAAPTLHAIGDGSSANANNSGNYVIGTFTADATSLVFSFSNGTGGDGWIYLNALQLRDVSATLTYNGNGSTGGSVPTDSSSPYHLDATVTVLGNTGSLTKSGGYRFNGWNTVANGSGTSYSAGATFNIAANTTLYAQWIPTYSITYDGNTSDGGAVPTDSSSPYLSGATVTVLGNTGSLTKSGGYLFNGWNTVANGSGTSYSAGATFNIAANMTLYAQWLGSSTITANATLPGSITTTYGTASNSTSEAVSGTGLTADITATAPSNLEVSSDNSTWGTTATFTQSSGTASGTLYVRIINNAPVSGSYNSQNVVLTTLGAPTVNVATTASGNTVAQKVLTLASATAQSKLHDGSNSATVTGTLQAAQAFGTGTSSDGKPYTGDTLTVDCSGSIFASTTVGNGISVTAGSFTLGGTSAGNYTLTQPTGLSLSANILSTATWTQLAGGSWTYSANWLSNLMGTGTDNTADFTTLALLSNATVTLDGARTIGNLKFDDQSETKYAWTLNTGSGGPLTLAVSSGSPVINNNVPTTIGTTLAGTQGLTKTGDATLTFAGNNTYTGNTVLNAGTLAIGSAANLPAASALTLSGGAALSMTAGMTLANNVTIASGQSGTLKNMGTGVEVDQFLTGNYSGVVGTLNLDPSTSTSSYPIFFIQSNIGPAVGAVVNVLNHPSYTRVDLTNSAYESFFTNTKLHYDPAINNAYAFNMGNGSYDLNVEIGALDGGGSTTKITSDNRSSTLTITGTASGDWGGVIANGAGSGPQITLLKTGGGTQVLTGANTYSGTTTVNGGTLVVNGSLASGSALTVNVNGTLAGTGNVGGTVGGAGTVAPGSGGTGTLNTGAVSLTGTYACQVDGANCDKLAVTGSLTLTGATLAISVVNAPTATSYVIATYTTGAVPAFTTVTGLPGGYSVDTATPGQVKLVGNPLYYGWLVANNKTHSDASLKEYAFGTTTAAAIVVHSPTSITLGQAPAMQISGTAVTALYGRRQDYQTGGMTYKVRFSSDLSTWYESTDSTNLRYAGTPDLNNPTVVASQDGMDAVSIPFPLFIKTANGFEKVESAFMKIEITIP